MLYTDEAIKKRKTKVAKIKNKINIAVYIMLVPLLIYNISLIVQAIINPNKTPSFFGIKTYVIVSGSMMPEIEIGDVVIVKKTKEIKKGDIISFRKGHSVITHRIQEVLVIDEKIQYKTKGDNNNTEDTGFVSINEIEGVVVKIIPSIGKVSLVLKNKTLIITIIIVYYVYLLHEQSIKKRKIVRKLKREEYEIQKDKGKKDERKRA